MACRVVAAGTARDRKRVARAFKGHLAKVAMDEWGHTVLLTLLCMTDDTQVRGQGDAMGDAMQGT